MIDESRVAEAGALSPRAGVALLTLQLRSTLQEAVDAEAEVASVDVDASLWQLRSRLGPLMDDRRRALDHDLAGEQEQADAAVAVARAEAAQIVADARSRADAAAAEQPARVEAEQRAEAARRAAAALAERQAAIAAEALLAVEPPVAEPVINEILVAEPSVVESLIDESPVVEAPVATKPDLFDDPLLDWQLKSASATLAPPAFDTPVGLSALIASPIDVSPIDESPTDAPADDDGWAEPPAPTSTLVLPVVVTEAPAGSTDPQAMHVVIDADSFAKAFAAALAPVLEARNQAPEYPMHAPPAYMPVPAPAEKKSFWAHAWHPDVMLSGLAMVIVIIVLIAWTG